VPFLVRWPGSVKPGSQSNQTICHTDLMATCADLLGVKLPITAAEDSMSILPALLGKDKKPLREATVHHSINGKFALRQGPWKLELCSGSGGWGKPGDNDARQQGLPEVQLYNLSDDPAETKNLANVEVAVLDRLRTLLESYVTHGRSTPGPKQSNDVAVELLKTDRNSKKK